MRTSPPLLEALVAAAALALVGCGSGNHVWGNALMASDPYEAPAPFRSETVEVEWDDESIGFVADVVSPEPGFEDFALSLHLWDITESGTYDIDDDAVDGSASAEADLGTVHFGTVSGSLTVDAIDERRASGVFELTADAVGGDELEVVGVFRIRAP